MKHNMRRWMWPIIVLIATSALCYTYLQAQNEHTQAHRDVLDSLLGVIETLGFILGIFFMIDLFKMLEELSDYY